MATFENKPKDTPQLNSENEEDSWIDEMYGDALKFDYVRFTIADMAGIGRCRSVAKKHLKSFMKAGIKMADLMLLWGSGGGYFLDYQDCFSRGGIYGNISLKPEAGTLREIPWAGGDDIRVGEVLCEARWLPDYSYVDACPRYIARKQLQRLSDELNLKMYSGFEAEFVMFNKDGSPSYKASNYMDRLLLSQHEKLLYGVGKNLEKVGVDLECICIEMEWAQAEFTTTPTIGIQSPDMLFLLRGCTKEIMIQKDYSAHFMSVPFYPGDTGGDVMSNGLHFNFSFVDEGGNNPLYDPEAEDKLSPICKHWIAGIVQHTPALMAMYCPTVNCYRRMHWALAPKRPTWAVEDRAAAYRLKNHSKTETYIECRLPSGSANPYLVMAATVAAGLHGVRENLECPPQADQGGPLLPKTLDEALIALEADKILCEVLGDEFITSFVAHRRRIDLRVLKANLVSNMHDKQGFDAEWNMYKDI